MELKELSVFLRLTEPQLGTVGKDPEVYRKFIAAKASAAQGEEEVQTIPELEKNGWTGFATDEKGLFIYDYMIRGFMKNAGVVLTPQLDKKEDGDPMKQMKSKIDNLVFVSPRRIYFQRDGKNIMAAEEVVERPIRAMTAQGPRVALVRSDAIKAGATLSFTLKILKGPITERHIKAVFEYGQLCGLGQWRNGSYGRFEVVEIK